VPAARPRPSAPGAEEVSEQIAEDVLEAGVHVEAGGAALLEGGVAEAVVERAPLAVAQDLIGLDDLLEALLRGLAVVGVLVGVVLEGEAPVGLLDIFVGGVPWNPKHLIVVALHGAKRALTRVRVRAPLLSGLRSRKRRGGYSLTSSNSASTTSSFPLPSPGAPS
jgi:hypothetical protein